MMKLVNRLLIIAVIAFGAWFLIHNWNSVEDPTVEENNNGGEAVLEIENNGEDELVLDLDSDLSLEEQLEALRKKPTTTLAPLEEKNSEILPLSITSEKQETSSAMVPGGTSSNVTVYLFDGGIDISNSIVSEGTVSFFVRNDGRLSHDFSIEGKEDFGRIVPGETQTFVVNLSVGEYTVFSPRAVDQQLDMRETLIVESAE